MIGCSDVFKSILLVLYIAILLQSDFLYNPRNKVRTPLQVAQDKYLLDSLAIKDQKYRATASLWEDSTSQQLALDSANEVCIMQMFHTYGIPDQRVFYDRQRVAFFMVIQHGSLEAQVEFLPHLLFDVLFVNNNDRKIFALLLDRVLVRLNIPQIFGTQLQYSSLTKKTELKPLMFPSLANAFRDKIGLGDLSDYVASFEK